MSTTLMRKKKDEDIMPRLTIRLAQAEKEALEELSHRTGRTVSDLARLAISDLVAEAKKQGSITVRIDLTNAEDGNR